MSEPQYSSVSRIVATRLLGEPINDEQTKTLKQFATGLADSVQDVMTTSVSIEKAMDDVKVERKNQEEYWYTFGSSWSTIFSGYNDVAPPASKDPALPQPEPPATPATPKTT